MPIEIDPVFKCCEDMPEIDEAYCLANYRNDWYIRRQWFYDGLLFKTSEFSLINNNTHCARLNQICRIYLDFCDSTFCLFNHPYVDHLIDYLIGRRDCPHLSCPIKGDGEICGHLYTGGYHYERHSVSDSSTCQCPNIGGDPPLPPICSFPVPNQTIFLLDYQSLESTALDNWIEIIPGTTSSYCLHQTPIPCYGQLLWGVYVNTTRHINDKNIHNPKSTIDAPNKNTYDINSSLPSFGISEFNGPFYRTIDHFDGKDIFIGGTDAKIMLSDGRDYTSSGIITPHQVAQGFEYIGIIGNIWDETNSRFTNSPTIEFIDKLTLQPIDVDFSETTPRITSSLVNTFISGNKEDIIPGSSHQQSGGQVINDCWIDNGGIGCTCNDIGSSTGLCDPVGCSACVDLVRLTFDHAESGICEEWGDDTTSTSCFDRAQEIWDKGFDNGVVVVPPHTFCGNTGPIIPAYSVGTQLGKDVFASIYTNSYQYGLDYWSFSGTTGHVTTGGIFGNRPDLLIRKVVTQLWPNNILSSGYTLCCGLSAFGCTHPQATYFYDKVSVGTKHSALTIGLWDHNDPASVLKRKETPYLILFGGTASIIDPNTNWSTKNIDLHSGNIKTIDLYNQSQYSDFIENSSIIVGNINADQQDDNLYKIGISGPTTITYAYDLSEELCNSKGEFTNGNCEITGSTMCHKEKKRIGTALHPVWQTSDNIPKINIVNADHLCTLIDGKYTNGSWEWISVADQETCSVLQCRNTDYMILEKHFFCFGNRFDVDRLPPNLWPTDDHHISESEIYSKYLGQNPTSVPVGVSLAPCQISLDKNQSPLLYYKTYPYSIVATEHVDDASYPPGTTYQYTNSTGRVRHHDGTDWVMEPGYGDSHRYVRYSVTDYFQLAGFNNLSYHGYDWTPTFPVISKNNWLINRYNDISSCSVSECDVTAAACPPDNPCDANDCMFQTITNEQSALLDYTYTNIVNNSLRLIYNQQNTSSRIYVIQQDNIDDYELYSDYCNDYNEENPFNTIKLVDGTSVPTEDILYDSLCTTTNTQTVINFTPTKGHVRILIFGGCNKSGSILPTFSITFNLSQESNNCNGIIGRCCPNNPNDVCEDIFQTDCVGGWNDQLSCVSSPCLPPPPNTGACCTDGICVNTTMDLCGGNFDSTHTCPDPIWCTSNVPIAECCLYFTGPCCFIDSCDPNTTPSACLTSGGIFLGFNRTCDDCQ